MVIKYPSIELVEKMYCEITGDSRVSYRYKPDVEFPLEQVWKLYENLDEKSAIIGKSAYLWFRIAQCHGFTNANKRMGWHLAESMLNLNGWKLTMSEDDKFLYSKLIVLDRLTIDPLRQIIEKNLKEENGIKK